MWGGDYCGDARTPQGRTTQSLPEMAIFHFNGSGFAYAGAFAPTERRRYSTVRSDTEILGRKSDSSAS
jgi:hypothetical protein